MQWQPIETAPTDGTEIIIIPYGDVRDLQVSWFIRSDNRWANWDYSRDPTHWMPLPKPPTVHEEEK
jgi:hypothetical protein